MSFSYLVFIKRANLKKIADQHEKFNKNISYRFGLKIIPNPLQNRSILLLWLHGIINIFYFKI